MEHHITQEEVAAEAPARSALRATTLHGDSYALFDRLDAASIDLVITSPPYWGHRDYGLEHNWSFFNDIPTVRKFGPVSPGYAWYSQHRGVLGLEPYPEWYVAHLAEILDKAKRCLKPGGSMWINIGDTYFARWASIREGGRQGLGTEERMRRKTPLGDVRQEKQLLLIPSRFAIAMQERGWILRNDVIWHKPNAVPRPEGDRLRNTHEHFFHFVKKPSSGRASYYYDLSAVEPGASDVIVVNVRPGEDGHSATFPYDLVEPRIRSSSPPGGVVLDPFCGTGRALEVAQELGRNVIGFDAQRKFAELTESKLYGQKPTRGRKLRQ